MLNLILGFLLPLVIFGQSFSQRFQDISLIVQAPLKTYYLDIGTTVKQNPLRIFILTKMDSLTIQEMHGKNAILFTSVMHPRQSYSAKVSEMLFYNMIETYQIRTKFQYFLENGLIIFFPFVNIDGIMEWQTTISNQMKNLLRKNLNRADKCTDYTGGVDINRNFPSSFGTVETSSDPCKEQYRGKFPFSEEESKAIKNLFSKFNVQLAIDIHSYGNQWIYPYASDATGKVIQSHKLYPIYKEIINKLSKNHIKINSCAESLGYIADGVYIDWALDQGALSLAFQVGKNFNEDNLINQEIQDSLETIYEIMEKVSITFEKYISDGYLILKSTSVSNVELDISRQENGYRQWMPRETLYSQKQIHIKLKENQQNIVIKIVNSKIQQTINLTTLQTIDNKLLSFTTLSLLVIFCLGIAVYLIYWYTDCFRKQEQIYDEDPAMQSEEKVIMKEDEQ